jgi:glutathione S-transferase
MGLNMKIKYKVYGDGLSGNCYKIKLLLHFLNLEYEWQHIDVLKDETKSYEFKKMNANAKIPVLQIDDGKNVKYLSESNAILNYLANDTDFLPTDNYERASVLKWQFFEQYSHEPYIATARYINKYLGLPADKKDEYAAKQQGGHDALKVMDIELEKSKYLIGDSPTIADISLYAYTHVAGEGGFDLSEYKSVNRWLKDFEKIPNYVVMSK